MIEPDWMAVALEQAHRGIDEIPGAEHNPQIVRYFTATTLRATEDEVPWCAAFACWCLDQGGWLSTRSARARSFLEWGTPISMPVFGAVVVFSRGQSPTQGHVGFVYGQVRQDELLVLGGNQGNQVDVSVYPASRVLGYRLPDTRLAPVMGED